MTRSCKRSLPFKTGIGWGLKYSYGGDNRRGMSRSARMVVVKDGKWTKMTDWFELAEMRRQ